jgi:hypothetical protein
MYRRYVKEHSRCGAPGVALNAPKPDEAPSGMQGNRDEAMTVRQHEPVWELNPRLVMERAFLSGSDPRAGTGRY